MAGKSIKKKPKNAVKTLGSPPCTSNLKRKRKEGKSEKKRKDAVIPKSCRVLKDDCDDKEFDDMPPQNEVVESMLQDPHDNHSGMTVGSETEDDVEFCGSDEEDIGTNGQLSSEDSLHLSSFYLHLEHSLSKEEIDIQRNNNFNWEIPAIGMPNCKWTGTGQNNLEDLNINSYDGLKEKLYEHWMNVYKTSGGKDISSPKQKMFFSLCSSYRDIIYSNKRPFYLKGLEDTSIVDAYIMHSLNHVFRSRDWVKNNDAKLTKLGESADSDKFRDQGFTRPKVLILLPLASIVYRVVKRLIQLTPSAHKVNVEHMDRFSTKFGSEEHKGHEESGQESEIAKPQKLSKPSDFEALFGGNNEDDFMIGIKFTSDWRCLFSFLFQDMLWKPFMSTTNI